MKVKVKDTCKFSKYIGKIGEAEKTKCVDNAMFYPENKNPWRIVLAWKDLEVVKDV